MEGEQAGSGAMGEGMGEEGAWAGAAEAEAERAGEVAKAGGEVEVVEAEAREVVGCGERDRRVLRKGESRVR